MRGACRARSWRSALATAVTALVSEILVHSLDAFAQAVGLSEFFIADRDRGDRRQRGRARRRDRDRAARQDGARVRDRDLVERAGAVFLIPAVALLSFLVTHGAAALVPADRADRHGRSRSFVGFVVRDGAFAARKAGS